MGFHTSACLEGPVGGDLYMKNALVIGASGQVARALIPQLQESGWNVRVTSSKPDVAGAEYCNLGDPLSLSALFNRLDAAGGPWVVFLPGALTAVDRCETERSLAFQINTRGPSLVAKGCESRGWPLVFFSTEYVFGSAEYCGGPAGPYTEEDPVAPPCWYGACKAEAERLILGQWPDSLIVRTTWVYSWDPQGMNFAMQVKRHAEQWLREQDPKPFRIPVDQISNPTLARDLASAVLRAQEKGMSGILNLVGPERMSRWDWMEKILRTYQIPADASRAFQAVSTSELKLPAKRPLTAGLSIAKALQAGVL
jgi:dTDP-4-dehydrorhamnose reductase